MNIYEKIQKCRVELQKMKLKKSGQNGYSGFKYFELADFIPQVNELFEKYGLFSNFSIKNDLAVLEIIDKDWIEKEAYKDESIEFFRQNAYFFKVEFTSPTAEANVKGCTEIQSLGAVHTYLKRYLYLNALEIVENDSLDAKVGSKDFEPQKAEIDDLDILSGIDSLTCAKEISSYFNEYNSKVKNKSEFIKAINARRKAVTGS